MIGTTIATRYISLVDTACRVQAKKLNIPKQLMTPCNLKEYGFRSGRSYFDNNFKLDKSLKSKASVTARLTFVSSNLVKRFIDLTKRIVANSVAEGVRMAVNGKYSSFV